MMFFYYLLLCISFLSATTVHSLQLKSHSVSLNGIYFDSSKEDKHTNTKNAKLDTISKVFEIKKVNIDQSAERLTIKIEVEDKDLEFSIKCFNMLGKKVLDLDKKHKVSSNQEISFDISKIPNGIYICVLQSANGQRDTEKFIISR